MGRRDDSILDDDERADATMRRVLAELGHAAPVDPPPDIVTRTLRRMPPYPPAEAALALSRERAARRARRVLLAGIVGLFVLALLAIGLANLAGGETVAGWFGGGSSVLGGALLTLSLLARPLLHTLAANPVSFVIVPLFVLLAAVALWWRLLRLPAPSVAEVPA